MVKKENHISTFTDHPNSFLGNGCIIIEIIKFYHLGSAISFSASEVIAKKNILLFLKIILIKNK